jgi:alpha-glucosidase (family GH31 glycosyl hydrolase)
MVYDGLTKQQPDEVPVALARSGRVGSWKFGASQWNGDLQATWLEQLQEIIAAGLNAQMSGMGWWTHDIGAISDYRELLVRW